MERIEKSIVINAPVEKVFTFMAEPSHLPEIWPSMVEVKDIKQTEAHVGTSYRWMYKMAGMRFEGTSETTEYRENQRVIVENKSGIPSKFTWTYEPQGAGTKLTVNAEYTIPMPLLGKLAEPIIAKQNEREAETLLANLKVRMEGQ